MIRLPLWRFVLALVLAVAPWPAAWYGLYVHRSAPLAFLLYHGLCFGGGLLLRSPGLPAAERVFPLSARHLLGVILAANLLTLLLYTLVGAALLSKPHVLGLLSERGLPPATYLWLFPYFAFINPLAEEFFWRGGVYATLRHLFARPIMPAVIAAILFGAWHWMVFRLFLAPPLALVSSLGVMLIGVVFTAVYERTRRLLYPIVLHALAADAPLLLLLVLLGRS